MTEPKVLYRDITKEPEALSRAIHEPELRTALMDCGFISVGIVECKAPGFVTQKQLEERFEGLDATRIVEFLENGEVDEIMNSPDKTAFAVVEHYFGRPVISILSIATDGMIVETTMKPDWVSKESPKAIEAPQTTLSHILGQFQARLKRIALGSSPIWPHDNRPRSGYYVRLVETNQPGDLWLHHQRHLAQTLGKDLSIPVHDTINLYLCIKRRTDQIREHVGKWSRSLRSVNTILSILAIILLGFGIVIASYLLTQSTIACLLIAAIWLFLPISFVLPYLITGFTRVVVLPYLPGLKLVAVSQLMQEITP